MHLIGRQETYVIFLKRDYKAGAAVHIVPAEKRSE